ncbi:hypothetical protein XM38_020430 [Halomicronema hongdechloris C2206]|uniref:Polymerase beta nucleotidyltransferase domain-containing protein n=1 Tax=Halomicronema hongdechloris C2206 TaxID=1641165 RepID=A0A1Z3HLB2_9CYAN|nr:nucleotidyltransferase domain-containing protein [Halomicronema hongdechloris]ASC71093.1 hypothetical protein XM38_020430 [Halomicronema hongdechloris C2206]
MTGQSFDTSLLDRLLVETCDRNEAARQQVLADAIAWLDAHAAGFGLTRAYLFGSLIRPYRFSPHSDVDIAVDAIGVDDFFTLMAGLSEALGREVDLVELPKCHFADRIRQQGQLWTHPDMHS